MHAIHAAFSLLLLAGCGQAVPEATCSGGVCPDAASDGARDANAYSVADYRSFSLEWSGYGVGESFLLERDCLMTASADDFVNGTRKATVTVGAADCRGFEALVTSPEVLAGLVDPSTWCAPATDDYSTFTLTWTDGQKLSRTAGGCTHAKPFSTVRAEMHRLEVAYAPAMWPDAGGAADSAPAADSGDSAVAGDAPDGG